MTSKVLTLLGCRTRACRLQVGSSKMISANRSARVFNTPGGMLHAKENAAVVHVIGGVKVLGADLEEGLRVLVLADTGVFDIGLQGAKAGDSAIHHLGYALLRPRT